MQTDEGERKTEKENKISGMYMSILISQFLKPPSSFLVFIQLFSTSVSLFLLCKYTIDTVYKIYIKLYIYQLSSVAQSCPTLCDPMDYSTPGLPVHHQLLEFT